jgi:hypothetical protein
MCGVPTDTAHVALYTEVNSLLVPLKVARAAGGVTTQLADVILDLQMFGLDVQLHFLPAWLIAAVRALLVTNLVRVHPLDVHVEDSRYSRRKAAHVAHQVPDCVVHTFDVCFEVSALLWREGTLFTLEESGMGFPTLSTPLMKMAINGTTSKLINSTIYYRYAHAL